MGSRKATEIQIDNCTGFLCPLALLTTRPSARVSLDYNPQLRFINVVWQTNVRHTMNNLSHLESRALSAYFRYRAPSPGDYIGVSQPGDIRTLTIEGLDYIVLTNVRGILAVYRVRTVNGEQVLKGMKRWPKAIDEWAGTEPA